MADWIAERQRREWHNASH